MGNVVYHQRIVIGENEVSVEQVDELKISKRRKHHLTLGEKIAVSALRLVYHALLAWKNTKSEAKEAIAGLVLGISLMVPFYFLGQLEHPVEFAARFPVAVIQAACLGMLLTVGTRVVKDIVKDIKKYARISKNNHDLEDVE